jgi:hypothetical protein
VQECIIHKRYLWSSSISQFVYTNLFDTNLHTLTELYVIMLYVIIIYRNH